MKRFVIAILLFSLLLICGCGSRSVAPALHNIPYPENYPTHGDSFGAESFAEYVVESIDAGIPILVDWVDWGGRWQPWQWENGDIIAPAGALISSMEDLLKFAKMNMYGSLPYVDMLHKKYAESEKTFDQGLAWRIKKGTDISFHVGSAGAFSCILAMDRKKKQAAVIGLNYALVDIEEAAFSMPE